MENTPNYLNSRHNRWTVIEISGQHGASWLCRCECGKIKRHERNTIIRGVTKSCGCLKKTRSASSRLAVTKHGMEGTSEYRTWVDMRRRCHQPQRPDYKNYGDRGIYVCEEWRASFEAFFRDMGPRPEGHTIDRLQNDGPYSKQNCVWAPRKLQERNKRSNRFVQIDGRRMTVAEAAETYGLKLATAFNRLHMGWSVDDTFKRPLRGYPR